MGTIWVREFKGGLDTRRMPETTPGGSLIQGQDVHITRGGEAEKRPAFILGYTLPAATTGLTRNPGSLITHGTAPTMAGLPSEIFYYPLIHPTGQLLASVPSFDIFASFIYVVGEYADGSIHHFYKNARVTDWYEGRARASFRVTNGYIAAATAPVGSFEITGGTVGGGNAISDLTIDSVSIIGAPVAFVSDNTTTAAAVATAINSYTSIPEYTALASGQTVTVTATATGPAINGKAIIATLSGTVTTGNHVNMAGGTNVTPSRVENITVNGVSIISAPVAWSTSHSFTADLIVAAIQAFTSFPDYNATSVNEQFNIISDIAGAAPNGRTVVITLSGGLTLEPSSTGVLAGGADSSTGYVPGRFVKTFSSKMYSTSSSTLHFSAIGDPTQWTPDATGAGFIDMSSQASDALDLTAVAPYQGKLAVFAENTIQIEFVDPDPFNNVLSQTLANTGTVSGRSVTAFSDNDLFYCASSGLRSLRARDASNAAATTDIGVPIDTLIIEKLRTLTEQERSEIIGLVEPSEGRFWLIMKDTIYVFSYFPGAQISAWTVYKPGFNIQYAVVFNRRVYLRSGNNVYVFGGLDVAPEYDDTEAIVQLPYLDGEKPWQGKMWSGLDAACEGEWRVQFFMNPTYPIASDVIATVDATTFGEGMLPAGGVSTHISPLFRSRGAGYAKLGSFAVHFNATDTDDNRPS